MRNGASRFSITCGVAATRRMPVSPRLSSRARSPSESASTSRRRLRRSRSSPWAVSCTPRPTRSNSGTPSSAREALPEGATLLADKGYDSNAIREAAARKNAWANIPSRSNRKQRFAFSGWLYRQRNLVERFFNRIKHFRGIATRYDKCPENYLAAVKLICARIWCTACGGDLARSGA